MFDLARLVLALVCLAVSLTAVIKAPNLPAWMLSLGATEYGHWFALVSLAVAIPFRFHPLGLAASGVAIVAAGLFLSTLAQALPFGARLPAQLQAAFGPIPDAGRPFSWKTLIFGIREKQVVPETFTYSEGGGYSLRLNFFRSTRPEPGPCVVVLHTGGWNSGSPDESCVRQVLQNAIMIEVLVFAPAQRRPLRRSRKAGAEREQKMGFVHAASRSCVLFCSRSASMFR